MRWMAAGAVIFFAATLVQCNDDFPSTATADAETVVKLTVPQPRAALSQAWQQLQQHPQLSSLLGRVPGVTQDSLSLIVQNSLQQLPEDSLSAAFHLSPDGSALGVSVERGYRPLPRIQNFRTALQHMQLPRLSSKIGGLRISSPVEAAADPAHLLNADMQAIELEMNTQELEKETRHGSVLFSQSAWLVIEILLVGSLIMLGIYLITSGEMVWGAVMLTFAFILCILEAIRYWSKRSTGTTFACVNC